MKVEVINATSVSSFLKFDGVLMGASQGINLVFEAIWQTWDVLIAHL